MLEDGLVRVQSAHAGTPAKIVGRLWRGRIVQGFATPDRRFQFHLAPLPEMPNTAATMGDPNVWAYPSYVPIREHAALADDECILTTFKWNVHTQSRTANQVWLTEIVGDNPCWIHPLTAAKHNIVHGGTIRLLGAGAALEVTAHVTECIHPRVIAISASFGHWRYGRTASNRGVNPNVLIQAGADPLGGGQAWNDTVVRLQPVPIERRHQ